MADIRDISVPLRLLSWDRNGAQPKADSTAKVAGNDDRTMVVPTRHITGSASGAELSLFEGSRPSMAAPFIDVEFVLYPSEASEAGRSRLNAYRMVPITVTGVLVDTYV